MYFKPFPAVLPVGVSLYLLASPEGCYATLRLCYRILSTGSMSFPVKVESLPKSACCTHTHTHTHAPPITRTHVGPKEKRGALWRTEPELHTAAYRFLRVDMKQSLPHAEP